MPKSGWQQQTVLHKNSKYSENTSEKKTKRKNRRIMRRTKGGKKERWEVFAEVRGTKVNRTMTRKPRGTRGRQ